MKHAAGFLSLVNDAKTRVKEWNFRDVKQRMDAGQKFTLVDVREDNEWARGHLPGAVHLGKGVIERDIETAVPDKSTTLVLYCGGGFRSALAADNLQKRATRIAFRWTAVGAPGPKRDFPQRSLSGEAPRKSYLGWKHGAPQRGVAHQQRSGRNTCETIFAPALHVQWSPIIF